MRLCISMAALLLLFTAAHAEVPVAKAAREQTAQQLFHELKCVVCEGQSLADSGALYAEQMRNEIRSMLADGRSAADIKAYFTDRYGDSILMTPPLKPNTLLLWAAPLLFVAGGLFALLRLTREGRGTKYD